MKTLERLKFIREDAGLTLVEVIVSITILACISIPLMAYFSQSLQYSAITAKQQKATTLAQNLTEGLKSQQKLLVNTVSSDATYYTVPYLSKIGFDDSNITLVSGNPSNPALNYTPDNHTPCFKADVVPNLAVPGPPYGVVKYTGDFYENGTSVSSSSVSGNSRKYSVDITLSTVSDLNNGDHPILYGMDDSTDVVAIEGTQVNNAIMYFKSINAAYGNGNLDEDDIRDIMKRTIVVEYDYVTEGLESFYQLNIYYKFSCAGLRTDGSTNPDKFIATPLNFSRIKDLKNLYIMYSRITPTKEENDCDRVMIEVTDSAKAHFILPEIFLIIQNVSDDTSEYKMGKYSVGFGCNMDPNPLASIKIHTNAVESSDSGEPIFKYAHFKNLSSLLPVFTTEPNEINIPNDTTTYAIADGDNVEVVTDYGPLLRTINILTEVYELKSDGSRGNLLATYSSSKGE